MNPSYSDLRKTLIALKGTRAPIQRRWDFYRNDVDRPPYFPYLKNESEEHYRTRLKIAIAWCGAMADRIASYFRKPPIAVTFAVAGKEEDTKAVEAAALWQEIAKYNQHETFMVDVSRDAGVGGNAYTKERFRYFDPETGEELKTGEWRGRIIIDRVSEAFLYRPQIGSAQAYVEAWIRQGSETKIFDEYPPSMDTKETEFIEAIVPAVYDPTTGKQLDKSSWTIWQDRKVIWGPFEMPHRRPIQRFANLVSRPESEDGISDIEWAIPLNNLINHVITGASRAVQYHGEPKLQARGVSEESNIKWGSDQVLYLPEAGASGQLPELAFLTWDQNIDAAKSLYHDAGGIMAALKGLPQHMFQDLEGAGKVVSGIALQILYAALNQVCVMKEAGFRTSEEEMIRASLSQLAYYNGKPGYFDEVEVTVEYNPDRTPKDLEAEFDTDNKKKLAGLLNLVDLVVKYAQGITTREDAMKYLEERAKETARLRELGLVSDSFAWRDEQNQDGEGNPDEQDKDDDKGSADSEIPAGD